MNERRRLQYANWLVMVRSDVQRKGARDDNIWFQARILGMSRIL